MVRLSVNINKIALIRNSRGANMPDILQVAKDCERFGAQGITVHPRPDQRHIRFDDLPALKKIVTTEFNIEGYPSEDFIDMVCDVKPHQVTLVPDPPGALTSNAGWDTISNEQWLISVIEKFQQEGIRVSLFVDPVAEMVIGAKKCKADRIEFYTGPYAHDFTTNKELAIKDYVHAAGIASKLGIGVNAGHDLNLDNLRYFKDNLPNLLEVSIGHALICDALYLGLKNTIQLYLKELSL
ncbi:MAG: pyridoxine 5'-phosphate synthase [Saprospiraceae bacterium]|nr:pyridoxine 5'-phosphate synthase [Saprospiraceae bacterium]